MALLVRVAVLLRGNARADRMHEPVPGAVHRLRVHRGDAGARLLYPTGEGAFEDSLGHIGKPLPSPQYQYQQTQPLPKPTTWCDSTRVGNTVYTTCQ
jgi:hypothetical protein